MSNEELGRKLYDAAKNNIEPLIREVLSKNPPLEVIDYGGPNGCTPLDLAARRGNGTVCRLLLQHGALVTSRSIHALHWADVRY